MDSRQVDLALRKQKLQMHAAAQRADLSQRLAGIDGALDRVDSLRDNLAWAKDKIPLLSVALLRRRLEPSEGSRSATPRRRRTG